jgi:hypothetical protein
VLGYKQDGVSIQGRGKKFFSNPQFPDPKFIPQVQTIRSFCSAAVRHILRICLEMEVGHLTSVPAFFYFCTSEMSLGMSYMSRQADTEQNIWQLLTEYFTWNYDECVKGSSHLNVIILHLYCF